MTELTMGANAPLEKTVFNVRVDLPKTAEIDVTALLIYPGGKVRGDGDMCFYGQTSIADGGVTLTPGPVPSFDVDLSRVSSDVEKIVLNATAEGGKTFGDLGDVTLRAGGHHLHVPGSGRKEAALILAEVYKRNGAWKIRNVGQGFNGGLRALAEHFGVDVADEAPSGPASTPPVTGRTSRKEPESGPSPAINLSKVNLTKSDKTISLEKGNGRFGKIRVNLNWNQKTQAAGFLGLRSSAIDLDLGALVEDRHGNVTAVQALGGTMGDYSYFPYVRLLGDDRTGAVSDGEWLEINGDMWPEIHRVLVYAFIYEGAPNWRETDGVVRVLIPDQPEIEVRMDEIDESLGMCAVALLENANGAIRANREVKLHRGHRFMDEAYGWGLDWRAGRK